jgi:phosphate-selective porin OprO and OprP
MSSFRKTGAGGVIALLLAGAATSALAQSTPATPGDDRDARISQLESEVHALMDEVHELKRDQATQIQTLNTSQAAAPSKPSALASIANGRPTISSADGAFSATLHGVMQFDAAQYLQPSAGPTSKDFRRDGPALGSSTSNTDAGHARDLKDGDFFRRSRIGIDGTVFSDFDYRLLFDFAGSGTEDAGQVYETWLQYSGLRPAYFRIGAFSESIGLEDQGSTNGMLFLERPGATDVARNIAAGDTRTGAQLFGYGQHWFVSAAVTGRTIGVVNTGAVVTINSTPTTAAIGTAQTYGDQLGFVGRLAGTPLHGSDWLIHVGVHGSYVDRPADASGPGVNGAVPISASVVRLSDTPELRVDGTKLIDTGNIDARHASTEGLEIAGQKGRFFAQGEYEHIAVQRSDINSTPSFSGEYLEAGYFLTDDTRRYNAATAAFDGPAVNRPLSPSSGQWGALELALRYSDINLNYHAGAAGTAPAADAIRGGDQKIWTAGLNWYLNPAMRLMLDYEHVQILRLSPSASAFSTPTGAQIGQTYNAIALRSQVGF